MSGLDKIIETIKADAKQKAEAIVGRAKEQCEQIKQDTEAQALAIKQRAQVQGEQDANTLAVRINSIAEANKRKEQLTVRRGQIDQVITGAVKQLNQQSDEQKLALYQSFVQQSSIKQGLLQANQADQHLLEQLVTLVDGDFKVDKTVANISGGIIVKGDELIDNFSFDVAIRDHLPELSALAAQHIFKE